MYGKYALGVTKYHTACTALKFFIVKTSRQWCLGFNWIRRKISRKREITEGGRTDEGAKCPVNCGAHLLAAQCTRCTWCSVSWHRYALYVDKITQSFYQLIQWL